MARDLKEACENLKEIVFCDERRAVHRRRRRDAVDGDGPAQHGRPRRPRPGPVAGLLRRPDGPDLPGLRPRSRRPRSARGAGRSRRASSTRG
ncbi:MAG: hypothetical protein MZV70_52760 [Desulfobacterales bacterium]|nr:hypothetical protein [Desulfobacterales bacterium]